MRAQPVAPRARPLHASRLIPPAAQGPARSSQMDVSQAHTCGFLWLAVEASCGGKQPKQGLQQPGQPRLPVPRQSKYVRMPDVRCVVCLSTRHTRTQVWLGLTRRHEGQWVALQVSHEVGDGGGVQLHVVVQAQHKGGPRVGGLDAVAQAARAAGTHGGQKDARQRSDDEERAEPVVRVRHWPIRPT